MKRGIVGAANSQEEIANGRGPARAEEDRVQRARDVGESSSCIFFFLPFLFHFLFSGLLCWRVSIVESSSRREERARIEGLTPTQQQDGEQDDLVGGQGPTQRSSSGGGATGSVEEGTVHGNTLATVSASFSRSVQLPEVESQALDGDRSGRGGHESRRNTRTSPGREGRGSVRHHREQTNPAQYSYQQEAGAGRDYSQLAVFDGPPQARWGPVGAPQHQQRGWTPQRRYNTGAQHQPQQGEAPQQQGAAMGGGGMQQQQQRQQQRGWSPQQLSEDAPRQQQQQVWPTQQPHSGGTPQQPQQGWGPDQGVGGYYGEEVQKVQ